VHFGGPEGRGAGTGKPNKHFLSSPPPTEGVRLPEAITAFEQLAQLLSRYGGPYIALGEMSVSSTTRTRQSLFSQYPENENSIYVQLALAGYLRIGKTTLSVRCIVSKKSFEKDPSKQ